MKVYYIMDTQFNNIEIIDVESCKVSDGYYKLNVIYKNLDGNRYTMYFTVSLYHWALYCKNNIPLRIVLLFEMIEMRKKEYCEKELLNEMQTTMYDLLKKMIGENHEEFYAFKN